MIERGPDKTTGPLSLRWLFPEPPGAVTVETTRPGYRPAVDRAEGSLCFSPIAWARPGGRFRFSPAVQAHPPTLRGRPLPEQVRPAITALMVRCGTGAQSMISFG